MPKQSYVEKPNSEDSDYNPPPFYAQSAFIVLVGMLVAMLPFFYNSWLIWQSGTDDVFMRFGWRIGRMVGIFVVIAIIGHVIAALWLRARDGDGFDREDERDKSIDRRAEVSGSWITVFGCSGLLLMAATEMPHYLIANAALLILFVYSVTTSLVKLWLYKRGY